MQLPASGNDAAPAAPQESPTTVPAPGAPLSTSARHRVMARVQGWRERHARGEMVLFLGAGFVFDVVTLSRIDDWATLAQQGAYLGLLGWLLGLEQRYRLGLAEPRGWWARVWRFSEEAVHFLFGSLLSSFALFYFKSANLLTSFAFLGVLFGLLVANELPRFRALGPVMRVALYSLCITSYLAYLLPVLVGRVRPWLFVLAVLAASALLVGAFRRMARWSGSVLTAGKQVLVPGLGVQALLLALYFLRLTPPVPLAMEQMGIYHEVKREGRGYLLAQARPTWGEWWSAVREKGALEALGSVPLPTWKVWQRGDQEFLARPGDKVYAFARIFAPARFEDEIVARWYYDDPARGWVSRGEKVLAVRGAGERGYRTFSTMGYRDVPGDYRVDITTQEGHVIGQLRFTIVADPDTTTPRVWHYDRG